MAIDKGQGLTAKRCVPCDAGTPPLTETEARTYLAEVPQW